MVGSLNAVFEAFKGLKVLIVGDVMVDSYIWGKVERISPEAPVPVVLIDKREKRLGGAGNVALNVQAMGATPMLCSVVGDDPEADMLINLMNQKGLYLDGIIRSENRITTLKERIISGSQHILRVDSETDKDLTQEEEAVFLERIKSMLSEIDVVVFQDYDKGTLNKTIIDAIIEHANEKGIPTVVDPKKKNFLSYNGASLFKPNLKELREGLKLDIPNELEQVKGAVKELKKLVHCENTLITLSEKGVYIETAQENHHIPAHIRKISDVSGAGDTVISIAALCMALKLSPKFTAGLSNLAGGLVCEYVGVVPINKESLLEEAEGNGIRGYL
ncbi:MAG: bifunctional ADP-heptose synthase [Bacteroidota bacterium]|nr:bifunctional ADP-heptose synthase [Bacteroidota bacterium]MDQ3535034.1 bifunctional ADP-heptose synthase [Bacteroidota bacterium]